MTLDELSVGHSGVITQVGGEGILRCRLLDMGLIPHTKIRVNKIAPMGDPMELFLRGYTLTLRKEDAHNITINPAPSAGRRTAPWSICRASTRSAPTRRRRS